MKKQELKPESLGLGKVPPQATDLEEAVLGALMLEPISFQVVSNILSPESFYVEANKVIYEAIASLHKEMKPVDILTVTHEVRSMGKLESVGGALYISQLTNRIATAANIETHARIIIEKHLARQIIHSSSYVAQRAFDDTTDVFDLLKEAQRSFEDIGLIRNSGFTMPKFLGKEMIDQIMERMKPDNKAHLRSSIYSIQSKLNGFFKDELIVIAARPGVGKTAYVLSEMYFWGYAGYPVGIFTLEMSAVQLMMRVASMITGIDSERLTKKSLTDDELLKFNQCLGAIESMPFFIDDTAGLNIDDLRMKAKVMVQKHKCRAIIVDYLQLLQGSPKNKGNREQEISEISRKLKLIAKENHVPVIALSQLSRDVEKRGGKPRLSDLRESGAIEQDADVVAFLYRPCNEQLPEDEALFIIEKNRAGGLGAAKMRYVKEKTLFTNYSKETESFIESKKHYDNANPTDEVPF